MCFGVICVTLSLGLWPFHVPANDVMWQSDADGLRFGGSGTVLSAGDLRLTDVARDPGFSFEIQFRSRRPWDSGTLVTFIDTSGLSLALRQNDYGVQLVTRGRNAGQKARQIHQIDYFPRRTKPPLITVASGLPGTEVYLDGALIQSMPGFAPFPDGFSGHFVLGDSSGQSDPWSGVMLMLAIYRRELTAPQVLAHYEAWRASRGANEAKKDGAVALYLFDERQGSTIHDEIQPGVDLRIPETYTVADKIVLEPFWEEYEPGWRYWTSIAKNIVGFVPLGFCVYPLFANGTRSRSAAMVTVAVGALVSLTIEVFQAFLPTRDSGTTDLITNILGTLLGVLLFRALYPWLQSRYSAVIFIFGSYQALR